MPTLVTGGKGFLGAALTRALLAAGEEVVCLDLKATPGRLADLADKVTMLGGGLPGLAGLEELVRRHRIDRIAHMVYAAASGEPSRMQTELETMVMGTVDVFETARRAGLARVVFPSSIHFYGAQALHGEVYLDETAPGLAATVYGRGKQLNEAVAAAYVGAGVSIVCLRVPAVYGPGSAVGARAVNLAAVQAARGLPARIPYRSGQRVCVAHVDDVASCLARALLTVTPKRLTYNVGGHVVTYSEIADAVRTVIPEADIAFEEDASDSDLPFLISDDRARAELGLRHRSLAEGMASVIDASRDGVVPVPPVVGN